MKPEKGPLNRRGQAHDHTLPDEEVEWTRDLTWVWGRCAFCKASASETKSTQLMDMLARLKAQMRAMQSDIDARLDAIAEGFEASRADDEAERLPPSESGAAPPNRLGTAPSHFASIA